MMFLMINSCKQEVKHQEIDIAAFHNEPIITRHFYDPTLLIVHNSKSKEIPLLTIKNKATKYHLKIEEVDAGSFVFNKRNGNSIELHIEPITGYYDYIIFNAVDDPVAGRFDELDYLLSDLFNIVSKSDDTPVSVKEDFLYKTSDTSSLINNILPKEPLTLPFCNSDRKPRNILIQIADNKSEFPSYAQLPDLYFVTQRVDSRKLVGFSFENDLITYNNTDRYFTSGVSIFYQAPGLGNWKISRLLFPYKRPAYIDYQLRIDQNMYTPFTTLKEPELKTDRPYSSYVIISLIKKMKDPAKKLIISNALTAGYQGPESPGGFLQSYIHKIFPTNDPPLGWETQLSTDYFLNYQLIFEKALISKERLQVNLSAHANAGSMHDNAGIGIHGIMGIFESPFGYLCTPQRPKVQAYLFTENSLSGIAYDATLQGGIMHTDDLAALPANSIQRIVFNSGTGLHLAWKNSSIEFCQHYLSPEFKRGRWHKWGRVSITLPL